MNSKMKWQAMVVSTAQSILVIVLFALLGCGQAEPGEIEATVSNLSAPEPDDAMLEMMESEVRTAWPVADVNPDITAPGREYLVVASENNMLALEPLLEARIDQGFTVQQIYLEDLSPSEGISQAETIRAQLAAVIDPAKETFILLAGSNLELTMPYFRLASGYYAYTDLYYANLHSDFDSNNDGDLGEWGVDDYDLVLDAHIGRVPIDNPKLTRAWAIKTLWFELTAPEYRNQALLAAGYIALPPDSAIGQEMTKRFVLEPAGFEVTSMYEAMPNASEELADYEVLTEESLINKLQQESFGLVFWMSHGDVDGGYLLYGDAFIDKEDVPAIADRPPAMFFSSACLNSYPQTYFPPYYSSLSIGQKLMGMPAVSFVGSTVETYPGTLMGGVFVLLTGIDRVAAKHHPVAVGVDEAREMYVKYYWNISADKGAFLQNFFGFSVYGDPGLRYPALNAD